MEISISYEDNSIVVICKPPGVVVNRAKTVCGQTIQDWVEQRLKKIFDQAKSLLTDSYSSNLNVFINRSGIVHRIDKETSGCLMVAKTVDSFVSLQQQFKQRTIKKTYIALIHGVLPSKTGTIKASVGRLPWNRQKFGVLDRGREAETRYETTGILKRDGKTYSKIAVYPRTGRTHQIRVHLKYMNHPIVSDSSYVGKKTRRHDLSWCPRMFLHAKSISFIHPVTKINMQVECVLPNDLISVLEKLCSC